MNTQTSTQFITLKEAVKIANKSEKQIRRKCNDGTLLTTRDGDSKRGKILIDIHSLKKFYGEDKKESEELTKTEKVLTGSTKKLDELYKQNMELQEENKLHLKLLNSGKDEKIIYEKNIVKYKGMILFLCFVLIVIIGINVLLFETKIVTFS